MKKILLLLSLAFTINLNAQDDKTVTLVVSGQGKTQEEARQMALRSAIEQAFGTFISSKTEILNDELVKDEIVSVTNGNIQKYEPVSEVQLPDGAYATTLKATVSVSKLTTFCENKGVMVEFKGGLFAMNIKIQQLNEQNEIQSIKTLCQTLKSIADRSFNYTLKTTDPKALNNDPNKWKIDLIIDISANQNLKLFKNYLIKGLEGISLTPEDQENYLKLNKKSYKTMVDGNIIVFRTLSSIGILQDLCWYLYFSQANFIINDGINNYSPFDVDRSYMINFLEFGFNSVISNVVDFKYPRTFESTWDIIEYQPKEFSESDFLKNTPFGDFSERTRTCTYELTKNAIILKYNEIKKQVDGEYNKEYFDSRFRCFADSSTVYVSARGEIRDRPLYKDHSYIKIHPYPNSDQFATLTLSLTYVTDELGKISNFTVKPSKQE
jgi:hypothetical protein